MKKIISVTIALVLLLSLSGCRNNIAQKLTAYTATFTMATQYDISENDLSGTICFPMTSVIFANTCINIIVSDRTLNPVAEELNNRLTASQIREMLSIEAVEDTSALKISVTSRDSQLSLDIAQAIAEIAPDKISDVFEGGSVRIIDNPEVTEETSLRNLFR